MMSPLLSLPLTLLISLVCLIGFAACSEGETVADVSSGPILPDFGTLGLDSNDGLAAGGSGVDTTDGEDGPEGADAGDAADAGDETDGTEVQTCCTTDLDCPPERSLCAPVTTEPVEGEDLTSKGMCQEPLVFPGCVRQADCGPFGECVGVVGCACDDNICESQFGLCEINVPEGCCEDFTGCGPSEVCVKKGQYGQCLPLSQLLPGGCYTDESCPEGQICVGASTCDCAEPDCIPAQGACVLPGLAQCKSNDDCNGGACMAIEPCSPDCPLGDPSCWFGNQCIFQTSECVADADCSDGPCIAGGTCYSWCTVGDPSCCFGNTCYQDPCSGDNPQGCYFTGCGPGKTCAATAECIPSACTCSGDGWACSNDCLGGACVTSPCVGKNPEGCSQLGCPDGYLCEETASCIPTSCTCNESIGAWECSGDCTGGECVKL